MMVVKVVTVVNRFKVDRVVVADMYSWVDVKVDVVSNVLQDVAVMAIGMVTVVYSVIGSTMYTVDMEMVGFACLVSIGGGLGHTWPNACAISKHIIIMIIVVSIVILSTWTDSFISIYSNKIVLSINLLLV